MGIIPSKINVGFQKRYDTYTKKLAYVIYYDEKGKLHKEKSWDQWRDKNIPNKEYENVPMEGFVLNKHAGGHKSGWDYRQSYIRVYDPRDFEFEITVDNLLYILENCPCTPGKGLEGKFVYTWHSGELFLCPVNSDEYNQIKEEEQEAKAKKKEPPKDKITNTSLKAGLTYRDKNDWNYVYLGQYAWYRDDGVLDGTRYVFAREYSTSYKDRLEVKAMKSANGKFVEIVNNKEIRNLDEVIEKLQYSTHISPIEEKTVDAPITLEEFQKENFDCKIHFYENGERIEVNSIMREPFTHSVYNKINIDEVIKIVFRGENSFFNDYERTTIRKLFEEHEMFVDDIHLKNGRKYYDGLKKSGTITVVAF